MTNQWWEIKINGHPDLEETFFWRLTEWGCQGTVTQKINDNIIVTAYAPTISIDVLDLAALSLRLRQDAILSNFLFPTIEWDLINEEDWASSWKDYWHPMEIGDRLLINPAWLEVPEQTDRIVLRLDPGSAFGTGVHATTKLCLESLEMRLEDQSQDLVIADIGCGSGILSIAASLFGVKEIYSVDVDPLAVKATHENSLLNNIQNIHIAKGSIDILESENIKFDGFVCNILADVIKDMIPQMVNIIKPSGWGVLSGILIEQSMDICNVLEKNGWKIAAMWKRESWSCIHIRR